MREAKDSVRERWAARNAGKSRVYKADPKVVHAAARASLESLGFRYTRGGAKTGVLEAVSTVSSSGDLRGGRQLSLKAQVTAIGAGTQLTVQLTEIVEDNFNKGAGQATETPLRDTPLYEVLFREVEKTVGQPVDPKG